ncbi:O-acetyl-ADP-ribose deacetylase MACROD2 [Orchesella cincta]|uniref:O-acetyl-ADP-ribose deacetylase MACROD2 n=1 Tax=Orchesella cincta TaxID=48709 RepID=A0A1D2MVY5_ORCCI|nr:O-acetyl-ADP-ribose deacetylase MACROD2 [Orchesella cincta]
MTTLLRRFPFRRSFPVEYLGKQISLEQKSLKKANCSTVIKFASSKSFYRPASRSRLHLSNTLCCQQTAYIMSSAEARLSDSVQAAKVKFQKPYAVHKVTSALHIFFLTEKYLNMELDKKRSQYKCGDRFVTLEKVQNWIDYFKAGNVKPVGQDDGKGKYSADEGLSSKVSLWQGDITVLEIDAIVNAANSSLLGGGGVDGAIHRAAGGSLLNECEELRGCPAGQAKITGGYKLPSKHVVHTVGPQGEKPDVLRSCYVNSLHLMLQNELRTIAFPCIATGVYGYPRDRAANVALTTVREFLEKNSDKVDRVIFTVFLEEDKQVYEDLMQKYFPIQ